MTQTAELILDGIGEQPELDLLGRQFKVKKTAGHIALKRETLEGTDVRKWEVDYYDYEEFDPEFDGFL